MPNPVTKYGIATNERISKTSPWTWHKLPSGEPAEFSNEDQTMPVIRELKRANLHVEAFAMRIAAGVDADSYLPKN